MPSHVEEPSAMTNGEMFLWVTLRMKFTVLTPFLLCGLLPGEALEGLILRRVRPCWSCSAPTSAKPVFLILAAWFCDACATGSCPECRAKTRKRTKKVWVSAQEGYDLHWRACTSCAWENQGVKNWFERSGVR